MSKGAEDRLDGQSKVISNVLPRHRQLDRVTGRHPPGHLQKEADYPLLRGRDQQQNVVLHPAELASGKRLALAGNNVVALGEAHHDATLDHASCLGLKGPSQFADRNTSAARPRRNAHVERRGDCVI
jgi:hypothetical protein